MVVVVELLAAVMRRERFYSADRRVSGTFPAAILHPNSARRHVPAIAI
jgi:hypothetical protein